MAAPNRGRVLLAAKDRDHADFVARLLSEFEFSPCAIASSADEVLRQVRTSGPEVVLMDTELEGEDDGVCTAERLQRELGLRVVYLSASADPALVERAKQTLPYGYLLKPIRPLDLCCCVELAIHARRVERAAASSQRPAHSTSLDILSAREVEVLRLIARGHTSKDIASSLRIAKPTVDTYRARLSEKLGIKSRTELMRFAAKEGLLARLDL